jgi:hypothetical protein
MKVTMKRSLYSYLLLSLGSGALMETFASSDPRLQKIQMQTQRPQQVLSSPGQRPVKSSSHSMKPWEIHPGFQTYFSISVVDFQGPARNEDLFSCLAKINAAGSLDGKVRLFRLIPSFEGKRTLFPGQNFNKGNLATIARDLSAPVAFLNVNQGKRALGLFPYFFNSFDIYLPNGGTNTCSPGYLYDTNVMQALEGDTLGLGAGWKNQDVYIKNWHALFEQGLVVFFVWFNGELFIVTHENIQNFDIQNTTSDLWSTNPAKKTALGLGAAGVVAGVAAGGYVFSNKNLAQLLTAENAKTFGSGALEAGKIVGSKAAEVGKIVGQSGLSFAGNIAAAQASGLIISTAVDALSRRNSGNEGTETGARANQEGINE